MKKTKYDIRIEQQFLHNLNRIVETFPQYTLSQHLIHFLRTKGDKSDVYFWSNEKTLSKIEEYYDELIYELSTGGFRNFENY